MECKKSVVKCIPVSQTAKGYKTPKPIPDSKVHFIVNANLNQRKKKKKHQKEEKAANGGRSLLTYLRHHLLASIRRYKRPSVLSPLIRTFLTIAMTTLRLVLVLVVLLLGRAHMRPQETGFDPAVARKMMEFKTEMIKTRILQEVNLLEPPVVTEPVTVSEDMLRLLESKDLEESILGEGDNLIAYPVNDDTSCENVTSCSRYEYELPADNKLSFVHIWIRNADTDQPMDLSVCVAYSADIDDRPCELLKNATEVKREKGWGIYELPKILASESYGEQLLCTVDVIGPPVNDMKDDQKPFIVASRNNEATLRRRRSTGSGGTGGTGSGSTAPGSKNCTCCLVDFHVSFEDINWHWVVAPKKFNAYMCYGKCSSQINSYRSNYHQMVHTVTNINKTTSSVVEKKAKTPEEASWTPCCSPTKLSPLSMIYVEGNTTAIANSTKAPTYIYHKIPNMITESCGCW